jgi:hypothetical protein
MAFINVNLNDVEDQSGEAHPEGRTDLRIVASELKESKGNKNPYINWRLEVVGSENKKPIWMTSSLLPQALFSLKSLYKVCVGEEFNPEGFDTTDLHGCEFSAPVVVEEYNGQKTNKVEMPYKPVAK